jgi:hypothetical protein
METSFEPTLNKRAIGARLVAESAADRTPPKKKRGWYRQRKPRLKTLEDIDGRCSGAIRAKQLVAGLESDLGGGANLSTGRRELVKHCALLGAVIEDFEVSWLKREPNPPMAMSEYLAALNVQRRLLCVLGLNRMARDVSDPDLDREWDAAVREAEAEDSR